MSLIMMLLGALAVFGLEELLYQKYWARGLRAELIFSEKEVTEGEQCELSEVITNRKPLPLPTLQVKFQMDGHLTFMNHENTNKTDKFYRNDVIAAMPYQRITRQLSIRCEKRGFYTIPKIDLVGSNLFLSQLLVKEVKSDTELTVMPAPCSLKGLRVPYEQMMGTLLTNRFLQEDPFEFRGIRPYQNQDTMKKINWKASAKSGKLLVNQYFETAKQEVVLYLNLEQEGVLEYEALLEESIRIAATLFEWFQRKGILVSLISNGRDCLTKNPINITGGFGTGHITACKRQLARIDLRLPREEFVPYLEEETKKIPILISYSQKKELQMAVIRRFGTGKTAQWIIPLHANMEHGVTNKAINPFYLEVGRS